MQWSTEKLKELLAGEESEEVFLEDVACLGALIGTLDVSVFVLENAGGLEGSEEGRKLGKAAARHLACMVRPLHAYMERRGRGLSSSSLVDFDALDDAATAQEWSQVVDFLKHLHKEAVEGMEF